MPSELVFFPDSLVWPCSNPLASEIDVWDKKRKIEVHFIHFMYILTFLLAEHRRTVLPKQTSLSSQEELKYVLPACIPRGLSVPRGFLKVSLLLRF